MPFYNLKGLKIDRAFGYFSSFQELCLYISNSKNCNQLIMRDSIIENRSDMSFNILLLYEKLLEFQFKGISKAFPIEVQLLLKQPKIDTRPTIFFYINFSNLIEFNTFRF